MPRSARRSVDLAPSSPRARWTRWARSLLLIAFHLANDQMFSIGVFPALAIAVTTSFFDHDWPRRALARLTGRVAGRSSVARAARARTPGSSERLALAVVALFALT
jgi:hypothetical protein